MPAKALRKNKTLPRPIKTSTKKTAAISAKPPEAVSENNNTAPHFPIVGIGASAGGLAAFESFFSGMPAQTDPGMAFVLVQHLAPDHKSMLTELVQRYTRMRVIEVVDGMTVEINCAYIIPPNRVMTISAGTLHLTDRTAGPEINLPIDTFFRSLASDLHEQAICIVLSGTGSDGTLGTKAVKGEGGLTLAQEPQSCEFGDMPRNAIATGTVDYVLSPSQMAKQLIAYSTSGFYAPPSGNLAPDETNGNSLLKLFALLREQSGHDFSLYKEKTIMSRLERRMAIHQIKDFASYLHYVQQTPAEGEALLADFLIGVTVFFRDRAAFAALTDTFIPQLLSNKPSGAPLRVWVAGCSTGEEAYSIAMLITEQMELLKKKFNLQIFATDINSHSIGIARTGVYPVGIAADVSPERLARFFDQDIQNGTFRINKAIRDCIVFSEQNVIKDPPLSRLDLISCRNLMIYLGSELQKKLIPLFHYALNPEGLLFLGTSETIGNNIDRFSTLERSLKIYKKITGSFAAPRIGVQELWGAPAPDSTLAAGHTQPKQPGQKSTLRELTEKIILQHFAPAGVLINQSGDILYLHGRTGMYLEPSPGESGMNILKMARPGLLPDLSTALSKAIAKKIPQTRFGVRVKTNGDYSIVNLSIQPVPAVGQTLFLVVLADSLPIVPALPAKAVRPLRRGATKQGNDDTAHAALIVSLKHDLRIKEEYLQTTIEELNSSNEEMQSVNEELQSTNEELETSKEELQSVNEELSTVNVELQTNVTDLTRANNDMSNLFAGTGIGTIFLDTQLRIRRFTPAITRIINLIDSDVGRPVSHIVSNLVGHDHLLAETQAVLDTLIPKEDEVQTKAGGWYLLRILPYRTSNNVIDGVVIMFIDITSKHNAKQAAQ